MSDSPVADPLELARDLILRPSGLDDGRLDRVFGEVLTHSVDFADLYFQLTHQESWSLEDGMVKDGSASIEQGVGVRALAGEKTGFAYSDEIVLPALEEASRAARAIAVQPEVILMDEPCSALDPVATARIEDLIDELRESYAIVVVTHSMQQAARVSQRTAYFHLGDLIEVGDTDRVFTNPRHRLTEDYITGRFG